jgi:phospholipid-translocating ATPase
MFTRDNSLFAMGDLTFTAIVILVSTKMQLIEMHNKSITAVISILLSVGGWFLWNILLAIVYSDNKIYRVRDAFFQRFGRDALWWLSLVVILAALVSLELVVAAGRVAVESAFGIGDVDTHTFQALEKDPVCKRRFEEAAAAELQQSWDHGRKKSSLELRRDEEDEVRRVEEQERRETEVREMLRNRPRSLDWERQAAPPLQPNAGVESGEGEQQAETQPRRSLEIQEMLRRGFGNVRKDSWRGA